MSRVGKSPINIPTGIQVRVVDGGVEVQGPKGKLAMAIPAGISVVVKDGKAVVGRVDDQPFNKALHGTTRSKLNNMVVGVSQGFSKELEIVGVGFKAEVKGGNKLDLTLGFTHAITVDLPPGIKAEVDKNANVLRLHGCDRQLVGQLAANIRGFRPPEPYKGKGIKYLKEVIRRKAGKAAAGTTA